MTIFGYLLLIGILSAGSSSHWLSPSTSYELNGKEDVDLPCRTPTQEERQDSAEANYGKASTFNLRGSYRCERSIFEYGDRNSFINLVTANAPRHSNYAARRIKNLLGSQGTRLTDNSRIFVDVRTDITVLKPYLEHAYQAALVTRLPNTKIYRLTTSEAPTPAVLKIIVNRVDDPETILKASLGVPREGGLSWFDI